MFFFLRINYKKNGTPKTGVIQQLTCMNLISVMSHIRRVCTPLDRVGRGSKPHTVIFFHLICVVKIEMSDFVNCMFRITATSVLWKPPKVRLVV